MERKIYLAGGCFWGVQHYFSLLNGVLQTKVGYGNSRVENPSYQQVKAHLTKAAETVEVIYDDSVISLENLLVVFSKAIDPTSLNKQGEDEGDQYRTGIYYVDDNDLNVINSFIENLQQQYDKPIVVEVLKLENFYDGEEYHQDYLVKNPDGYCHLSKDLFDEVKKYNR